MGLSFQIIYQNGKKFKHYYREILMSSVLPLLVHLKITGIFIENRNLVLPVFSHSTFKWNQLLEYYNLCYDKKDFCLNTNFHLHMVETFLFLTNKPTFNSVNFVSFPDFKCVFFAGHPFVNFIYSSKPSVFIDLSTINFQFCELNCCAESFFNRKNAPKSDRLRVQNKKWLLWKPIKLLYVLILEFCYSGSSYRIFRRFGGNIIYELICTKFNRKCIK